MFTRIVVITPNVEGEDGISTVSRHVLKALSCDSVDQEVECWSLGGDGPHEHSHFGIRFRSARGSKVRLVSWGLRAGFADNSHTLAVVLHLHLAPVALPLIARGARLAVFLHGIEAWNPIHGLRRVALRRARQVIGNSDYTISRFISVNPDCLIPEVRVCHLGISSQAPEPAPVRDLGLFALIVGRMAAEERYKGHDLLLELWPKVIRECPGADLAIVGDGDDRPRLQSKVSALGLNNNVKFFGKLNDDKLAALYQDCAFFVMPSPKEGFGIVFLEAMRANKACIGAIGAAAEVIIDGVTGIIVDPEQPNQVLREILRLFRTPELRLQMGQAGAQRFSSLFTEEHFQKRFRHSLELEYLPEELSVPAASTCHL